MITHYLHIPFPEDLDDEVWMEKWMQVLWLFEKGMLNVKPKQDG